MMAESSGLQWRRCVALLAGCVSLLAGVAAAQDEDLNPIAMQLSRQHPAEYRPGVPVEIMITISAFNADNLTAVGLYETVPPGWAFMGMRGFTGQPPAVAPAEGETGVLQFAWIDTPQLPFTFAYTVLPPETDGGPKIISGQIEYRELSSAQYSTPVITQIGGADNQPPVITLLGDNPMTLMQGTPFIEPGYFAQDNVDGDVSGNVRIMGTVDSNQPGQYALTYTATDKSGNQSDPVRRIVRVVQSSDGGGSTVIPGGTYAGGGSYMDPEAQSQMIAARRQRAVGAPAQPQAAQPQTPQSTAGKSAASALEEARQNVRMNLNPELPAPSDTNDVLKKLVASRNDNSLKAKPGDNEDKDTGNAKNDAGKAQASQQPPAPEDNATADASASAAPAALREPASEPSDEERAVSAAIQAVPPPPAPPAPGVWDAIAFTLRSMGPTQWAILGMVMLIVAALLVLTTIAGKSAYTGRPRRRNTAPQSTPGEQPPAGA